MFIPKTLYLLLVLDRDWVQNRPAFTSYPFVIKHLERLKSCLSSQEHDEGVIALVQQAIKESKKMYDVTIEELKASSTAAQELQQLLSEIVEYVEKSGEV